MLTDHQSLFDERETEVTARLSILPTILQAAGDTELELPSGPVFLHVTVLLATSIRGYVPGPQPGSSLVLITHVWLWNTGV